MVSSTTSPTQLGWLVQLPWTDAARRAATDRSACACFARPPPSSASHCSTTSERERLYVSRIGLNRIDSRVDRSADPAAVGVRSARTWFGDVTYNRGSEPIHDRRDFRQPTVGGRGDRRGEPQADLGRGIGDQGRPHRLRLRAGPTRAADRSPGHQPGAARRRRSHLPAVSGHQRRDRPRRDPASPPAATSMARKSRPPPLRSPGRTGSSSCDSRASEAFAPIYAALWRTVGIAAARRDLRRPARLCAGASDDRADPAAGRRHRTDRRRHFRSPHHHRDRRRTRAPGRQLQQRWRPDWCSLRSTGNASQD